MNTFNKSNFTYKKEKKYIIKIFNNMDFENIDFVAKDVEQLWLNIIKISK